MMEPFENTSTPNIAEPRLLEVLLQDDDEDPEPGAGHTHGACQEEVTK